MSDFLLDISERSDLVKFVLSAPDSRSFNIVSATSEDDTFIKTSENKKKMEAEFHFLNEATKFKNFMVKPKELSVSEDYSTYSMEKINGLDLSKLYSNNLLSDEIIDDFFQFLENYFKIAQEYAVGNNLLSNFMIRKNTDRSVELQKNEVLHNKLLKIMRMNSNFETLNELTEFLNSELLRDREAFANTPNNPLSSQR